MNSGEVVAGAHPSSIHKAYVIFGMAYGKGKCNIPLHTLLVQSSPRPCSEVASSACLDACFPLTTVLFLMDTGTSWKNASKSWSRSGEKPAPQTHQVKQSEPGESGRLSWYSTSLFANENGQHD